MNDVEHTFETPSAPTVVVELGAGRVDLATDDTDRTTVELTPLDAAGETAVAEAVVEQRGSAVAVVLPRHAGLFRHAGSVGVTITCPRGSTLDVRTGSAPVRARGDYAEASIGTGSGDIDVDTVSGSARLKSGSGDIRVGDAPGEMATRTGSGDVEVDRLDGTLQTKSGSGNLTVRRASAGTIRASGASGDISIGIEEGTAAWLDVSTASGRVHQELGESEPPGPEQRRLQISARTASGDLRVHRSPN